VWILPRVSLVLVAMVTLFTPAAAQSVAGDVSASIPETGAQSLAGALSAASVEPSSGVLRSALEFVLPAARGNSQPSLTLSYSSSAGIREGGVGWGLPLPVIERSTRRGAPRLDDDLVQTTNVRSLKKVLDPDEILFNGERLLPVCEVGSKELPCNPDTAPLPGWASAGWRYYRLRIDTHARFFWSPSRRTWRIQTTGSEILELGEPMTISLLLDGVVPDIDAGIDFDDIFKLSPPTTIRKTVLVRRMPFRWNLVRRFAAPAGTALPNNVLFYRWTRLGTTGRGYLTDIYYSASVQSWPRTAKNPALRQLAAIDTNSFAHHVRLVWRFIPQAGNRFTPVWRVTPDFALEGVDIASKPEHDITAARELVRRYHMEYSGNQRAFLQSFRMEGRCAAAVAEVKEVLPATTCSMLPATTLRWSQSLPNTVSVPIMATNGFPAPTATGWQLAALDVNADGLPDLVEINMGFTPDSSRGTSGFGAKDEGTRRAYIANGVAFDQVDLKGPAGLLSHYGTSITGDFPGTGSTGAVLLFPQVGTSCVGGGPESPCQRTQFGFMSASSYSMTRLGNSAGALWYQWEAGPPAARFNGQLNGFEIEATGDVNGDAVPDVLDANTDPWKMFPDPVADIETRLGARGADGGTAFAVETSSCVGPSMEEMRADFQWTGFIFSPDNNLERPRLPVALADMNGDTLGDLVLVGPEGIKYWPGDGRGNFSACRGAGCVCGQTGMSAPGVPMIAPILSAVTREKGWRLADLNGDGYADLIALGDDGVRIYLNIEGFAFDTPVFVSGASLFQADWPAAVADPDALRIFFADMNGNGLTDMVFQLGNRVQTFDLQRRAEPIGNAPPAYASRSGLLIGIDNGLGARTEIAYETTADLARSAIANGTPWTPPTPQNLYVVGRVSTSTNVPGDAAIHIIFDYSDPVWDGFERRFRGFRDVTATRLGTSSVSTHTTFFIPQCPAHDCSSTDPTSIGVQAASGVPLVSESFDDQGRYLTTVSRSYEVVEGIKTFGGGAIHFAYPSRIDTRICDVTDWHASSASSQIDIRWGDRPALWIGRAPIRCRESVLLRTTQKLDEYGNLLKKADLGRVKDDGGAIDDPIVSDTHFLPARPDWKFLADRTTVSPFPSRPLIPADQQRTTTFTYDAAGRLKEVKGLLTGAVSLDRSHEGGKAVAPNPPSSALNNTWISLAWFGYDAYDNVVETHGPNGRCVGTSYDPEYAQLPIRVIRYKTGCGSIGTVFNSIDNKRRWDRGMEVQIAATAQNGTVSSTRYDGFGRPVAWFRPDPVTGATQIQPYAVETYHDIVGGPVQQVTIKVNDTPTRSRATWKYTDGTGRQLLTLTQADPAAGDGGDWVASGLPRLGPGKSVIGTFKPWFYTGDPANHSLTPPPSAITKVSRDAFGRIVEVFQPDGVSTERNVYRPLSVQSEDAAGRWIRVSVDGHGRQIERMSPSGEGGAGPLGTNGLDIVENLYQVGGEVAQIVRSNSNFATHTTRWMQYDSFGRMVLNAEPNTSIRFAEDPAAAGTTRAWRYAYDGAGDLVGTSDARGCGENFHYDNLGRLLAEDYSPCLRSQSAYSPLTNLTTGSGAEAFYRYDAPEAGQTADFGVSASNLLGRVVSLMDRGAHARYAYDWQGHEIGLARQLAQPADAAAQWPGETGINPSDRYASDWIRKSTQYDSADRVVSLTTGAVSPELTSPTGVSQMVLGYSLRGLPTNIGGTYGVLIERAEYDAEGRAQSILHGDAAHTLATFSYDVNGRPAVSEVLRRPPALWTTGAPGYTTPPPSGLPTTQLLLLRSVFHFDSTGLLDRIGDERRVAEWPRGALPVTVDYKYDNSGRTSRVDYSRPVVDRQVDFGQPAGAVPAALLPNRIASQTYNFDPWGNISSSQDDTGARYDRSLGPARTGSRISGPDQMRSAANGALTTDYDPAGNLVNLVVARPGPCLNAAGDCTHRFAFDWDETGHLARARRWDFTTIRAGDPVYPAIPLGVPAEDMRYRYDAGGLRVISSTVTPTNRNSHQADVFETLRLERAKFDPGTGNYERDEHSEIVVLPGIGEVLNRPGLPHLGNSDRHVLIQFGDHLGSTAAVIDHATGELVERTAYQMFGAADSDYQPPRWGGLTAGDRYTGKREDATVGLTYFGARYYQAALGTFISADPLAIHGLGADLNPYAYVGGQPSMQVDPVGLDVVASSVTNGIPNFEIPNTTIVINPETAVETTTPVEISAGISVDAAAPAVARRVSPTFTGLMKVLVNVSPVVFGYAMITDPGRTIRTAVQTRLEMVESLLGEPNTVSDLSDISARQRGSTGQRAMDDTDQLISITEQEVEGAAVGAVAGRLFRGAASLEARGLAAEACPGGVCIGSGKCFGAGTMVATPEGLRPIESIKAGDAVLSRNETTGEISVQRVQQTIVTLAQKVVTVWLTDGTRQESVVVTPAHPFRVAGLGWMSAKALLHGMHVLTATGEVEVAQVADRDEPETVYNFEVGSTHTYFVGEFSSWVHNSCPTVFADKVGPGPFADPNGFITLRGPARDFTAAERRANNINGDLFGCHSCGTYHSGLINNAWVLDHQWPVALARPGSVFRGYPQCAACGLIRAGGTSQPFQLLRIKWR
jgi:RHS repeat-associated protein